MALPFRLIRIAHLKAMQIILTLRKVNKTTSLYISVWIIAIVMTVIILADKNLDTLIEIKF